MVEEVEVVAASIAVLEEARGLGTADGEEGTDGRGSGQSVEGAEIFEDVGTERTLEQK